LIDASFFFGSASTQFKNVDMISICVLLINTKIHF